MMFRLFAFGLSLGLALSILAVLWAPAKALLNLPL